MKPTIILALGATALLAGCQAGGSGGVLGSAAKEGASKGTAAYGADGRTQEGRRGTTGTNPHGQTRMKNTRNALSDYCPTVAIREGTGTYRIFKRGAEEDDTSAIRYQATIAKAARECAYEGESLKMRVGVRGRIINGPDGETGSFAMPIRVAVVEGKRTVYSKLHKPKGAIAPGTGNAAFSYVDEEVVIPAPRRTNVRVYVGFDEGPKG